MYRYKKSLVALLILVFPSQAFEQALTKEFKLSLPEDKISNSYYNSIEVLDSRGDTSFFGIVQRGAFNRKARVIAEPGIREQVQNMFQVLTGSTAKNGTLLLQFRQFSFAELTGATSERGYCYLKMDLYQKRDDIYYRIARTDTVLFTKAMDVTNLNFRKGSATIINFISRNLLQKGNLDNSFSFYELNHIDSLEKSKLPLYNIPLLKDGLYYSYDAFKNQVPDTMLKLDVKDDKMAAQIRVVGDNGKKVKLKSKGIYAVVSEGQPYIATEFGFYKLNRSEGDFNFIGKAKVTANSGQVLAAGFFFGIIGTLIASDASAVFEMKIDHSNGAFIRVREIKQPASH